MDVGIEAMNIYCGSATLNVSDLATARGLDAMRFEKLLINEKTVIMPYEDQVSNGVNAAKPILDSLSKEEIDQIDMIITCTESGVDFGKSISTYIHHYLGLHRNCRLFEVKNACYSGTAGLQMAINYIYSETSLNKKALVICTDIIRVGELDGSIEMSFAEPSSGSGAVAMLVSNNPVVFKVDKGANGYYGYEVMDTCRPAPDVEAGNADLSLLSYLDCCEKTFEEYQKKVDGVDYESTFGYLTFHTPFGGMVKGAHRSNMRKFKKANPNYIDQDFDKRVKPSLQFCQRVGNIMGATTHLALASTIENGDFKNGKRIGVFSYGSGCCSEFYSGVASEKSQQKLREFKLTEHLNNRYQLSVEEYENTFSVNTKLKFGTKNYQLDFEQFSEPFSHIQNKGKLILTEIKDYHRIYKWT
ncbi:hydroxymethylglutaryl-CoA synthase family protein [uncultured Aquimarina sp.]|uniref:hydroxymethylglutaryl-CoA synthase family protein n=1 Tax=uncultured Aquimarina sp. TaxID=575652 RepID=UPI00261E2BDE|nr:hydroxymethylglutaryl-CoA synthase family protein [uncultured Aquimarina sp.]